MQQPTPPDNGRPRGAYRDPAGNSTAELAPTRPHRAIRVAGRWYYVVMIATAGVFAWIPFLHAAIRLKTAKARRLAGDAIDRLRDKSAAPAEQAKRKRRLIKGPPEFRDMRADSPKAKPR